MPEKQEIEAVQIEYAPPSEMLKPPTGLIQAEIQ